MKYFLHKVQLHVSALHNGHLQVVHEILIKQLYKTYMGRLYGVGRGKMDTRSRICQKGWAVWVT
jgi:trans-2-enoyl-CoA reductase